MSISAFNIRVYGLLLHNSQILVAEQLYKNVLLRKFPGGGLDFGEGLEDCVKREFMEELNLAIEVTEHYYTTDFFVQSMFRQEQQVISVFYKVKAVDEKDIPSFIYKGLPVEDNEEVFKWVELSELHKEDFNLPIEKKVVSMLIADYTKSTV